MNIKERSGIAVMVVAGLMAMFGFSLASCLVVGVIGLALYKPHILDKLTVRRKPVE